MQRRLLIAAPLAVMLLTGAALGIWHAQANNPIQPLSQYVTYQQTYFVPKSAGQEATVQVWTWLRPEAKDRMSSYADWLRTQQGWSTVGGPAFAVKNDGNAGSKILPDQQITVSAADYGETLLIYSRNLSAVQAFFYGHMYKNLDINSPPPTKP